MNHPNHIPSAESAFRRLPPPALLAASIILFGIPCAGAATPMTLITFDYGDPIGGMAVGSTLSNQYVAWGVTFTPNGFSGTGGPTRDWAVNTTMDIGKGITPVLGMPGLSQGNLLRTWDAWRTEAGDPSFTVNFSAPVSFFSADFAGVGVSSPTRLFVYNGDVLLGSVQSAATGQITLSYSAEFITRVVVTPGSYDDYVGVDNIRFQQTAPEPGGVSLAGLGGLALVGMRRPVRKQV